MSRKNARKLFNVLIIAAAVLMIGQSVLSDQGVSWGWQGIGAIVLCVAAMAVHIKWNRCPHCGRLVARGAAKYCTYCGKDYEEE